MDDAHSRAVLKDLLETSRQGERGFALAVRDNREPGVADLLSEGEDASRTATVELHEQIRLLGGATEEIDAPGPLMYRGWIDFNAVPIARDTKLILEECERGVDYARSRYDAAMLGRDLPESTRAIVQRQQQRIVDIQGRLRLSRNRYPATTIPRAGSSAQR